VSPLAWDFDAEEEAHFMDTLQGRPSASPELPAVLSGMLQAAAAPPSGGGGGRSGSIDGGCRLSGRRRWGLTEVFFLLCFFCNFRWQGTP